MHGMEAQADKENKTKLLKDQAARQRDKIKGLKQNDVQFENEDNEQIM